MWEDFKKFLEKANVVGLALAVIVGGAGNAIGPVDIDAENLAHEDDEAGRVVLRITLAAIARLR